jgi:polyhydroxyalkanoate synthase
MNDVTAAFWAHADAVRQQQGDFLDRMGLGPLPAPARLVHRLPTVDLLAFHDSRATGPTLLIIPAPIKAWYIWDLDPGVSVVRRCVSEGLRVYLMAWRRPEPDDRDLGFAQYADEFIVQSLHAITAETGQARAFLAGHSLGGTLAAIFASLHQELVQGLVEVEGPMEFDAAAGRLEAAALSSPAARAVTDRFGNVPGSFLDAVSISADPVTFTSEPLVDWLQSLPFPKAIQTHVRVRRWTLTEMPMPRRLFEEVVELYRENRFAKGTLRVANRYARPAALTAPIMAVVDPRSRIIPAASITAYRKRTGSADVRLLEYRGDVGVMLQHVGVLVGENAHRVVWRRILDWIHEGAARPH